jgi:D-alanine transaminase
MQVFLNGRYLPLEQASISVLDRGFLFGDGVYEVIPLYAGLPLRFEAHIARLNASLQAIRMQPVLGLDDWREVIDRLSVEHAETDQMLYLQVTRGADSKREHFFPNAATKPTIFAMCKPLPLPDPIVKTGVAVVTMDDLRWSQCHIKATTLLANVLAKQDALDAQATEAILLRDGKALEGAASNLFIVKDGLIITPPKSALILPGITRDLVLELAAAEGLPWCEANIDEASLFDADEIWMTSSTKEVMPVTKLNGKTVSDGAPGPVWQRMDALFAAEIARLKLTH